MMPKISHIFERNFQQSAVYFVEKKIRVIILDEFLPYIYVHSHFPQKEMEER